MSAATSRRHACERCWRRKQKCDRKSPVCSLCQDAGVECVPRTVAFPGGPNSPGFVSYVGESYIQTLKRNIDHLQRANQRKRQRTRSPHRDIAPSADDSGARHGASAHEPSVHDALTDFSHFGLNSSPAEQDRLQRASTQPFSTWNLVRRVGMLDGPDLSHPGRASALSPSLAQTSALKLLQPRKETTDVLLERYVNKVLKRYPFMDALVLRRCYEEVVDHPEGVTDHSEGVKDSQSAMLIYVVLATSCALEGRQSGLDITQLWLRTNALRLCDEVDDKDSVPVMRCLTSIALHALHGTDSNSASYLSNVAFSKAVALGFHRAAFSRQTPPSVITEARRIFSTLYVVERLFSLVTAQPPALDDRVVAPEALERSLAFNAPNDPPRDRSLTCVISQIEHLHLIKDIRRSRGRPPIYSATICRVWLESSSPSSISRDGDEELFLCLKCRLLVALYQYSKDTVANGTELFGLERHELEDGMQSVLHWLRLVETRLDQGLGDSSVFDSYDIFAVAILNCHVRRTTQDPAGRTIWPICSEIHMLSISLLACLSRAISTTAPMRKVLCNSALSNPESCLDGAQSMPEGFEQIPRRFRDMLKPLIVAAVV